jgi:hypothetical protein
MWLTSRRIGSGAALVVRRTQSKSNDGIEKASCLYNRLSVEMKLPSCQEGGYSSRCQLPSWRQSDQNSETERARLDWHVGLYSPMENDPRSIASENPNQGTTEVEPQHIARCGNDLDSGVLDAVPRCQSTFAAFVQLINKVKGLRVQRH